MKTHYLSQGVSIIIPCYEAGNYLLECIESIKKHPIKVKYEIIIVDDDSKDNDTAKALYKLKNESAIRIIRNPRNTGQSASRNTGIFAANYEYIFMMDADDLVNTDKYVFKRGSYIDRAIGILNSDPDIAFVYSMTRMFGLKNEIRNKKLLSVDKILKRYPVPIGLVYRNEDICYDEPYNNIIEKWTDWAFAIGFLNNRIAKGKANKISFLRHPYYLYRQHNLTDRISTRKACEKKMLQQTLALYPKIFKIHFKEENDIDIINSLLLSSQIIRGYIPRACVGCNMESDYQCVRNAAIKALIL